MSYILGSGIQLPPHHYTQGDLADALVDLWGDALFNPDRLRAFFESVQVRSRSLALPRERYHEVRDFGARNLAWREVALDLLTELTPRVASEVGLPLEEIDLLVSTTVTGLTVPTLEARLMNRLPFPRHARRVPLFGLGCLAGAAGLARLHDLLGSSTSSGLLLAVELCSLTLRTTDLSVANLVASGLFGDGAGVVAMTGTGHREAARAVKEGRGCRIIDTRSAFFDDSEYVMGWEFDDQGFEIVLANDVPEYAAGPVCEGLKAFLAEHGLAPGDITHWLAHPGGPKVISALEDGLGLGPVLEASRRTLAEVGNLSSVSVLCLLDDLLRSGRAQRGEWGLLMAMGPAFCAEMVLLRWQS